MLITKKRVNLSNFTVKINGTDLEECDNYKYLGVFFDKNLNWKKHIDHICEKVSKSCGILSKLRHCFELETLRKVYHAFIMHHGIIAWGTAPKTSLKPPKFLMNRAIRILSFAPFGRLDLQPVYEILELLDIEQTYSLEIAKFAYRYKNSLLPTKIASYFETPLGRENVRATRQSTANAPQHTSFNSFGQKSIRNAISKVWIGIPDEIKSSTWFKSFKRMYKSHLILVGWN